MLASNPRGGTDYIEADLYDPGTLVSIARTKLDFTQPIAIMLMGVMGHIGNPGEDDDEVARSIVDRLKDALPSGGYLVMYEGIDTDPAQDKALGQYNESGAVPYRVRRPEQVARFFDGLELAAPGVVPDPPMAPRSQHGRPPRRPRTGRSRKKAVSPRKRCRSGARVYCRELKGHQRRTRGRLGLMLVVRRVVSQDVPAVVAIVESLPEYLCRSSGA